MFISPHVQVKTTAQKGKGVFATAEIPAGAVIGDYLGTIVPADSNEEEENGAVYDMWYSDKADICPDPDTSGVHLLNTSCEPNCAMAAIDRHTIIFALRKIFPGEELTYDYFLGEQDEDCKPGTDNCHCGSPLCRGTMYSNPMAYDAWDKYLETIMQDLPEEPPVAYGKPLPPLKEYPETIEDNLIYPLYGNRNAKPHICTIDSLSSMENLRDTLRSTGKQLIFPELGIIVEGIMYGGHILLKHSAQKAAHYEAETRVVETVTASS